MKPKRSCRAITLMTVVAFVTTLFVHQVDVPRAACPNNSSKPWQAVSKSPSRPDHGPASATHQSPGKIKPLQKPVTIGKTATG
jgi:hypothetical protein